MVICPEIRLKKNLKVKASDFFPCVVHAAL